MGTFESIKAMYYASMQGLPMPCGDSFNGSFGSPFSSPFGSFGNTFDFSGSVFSGMGSGGMNFSNQFASQFNPFGGFGGGGGFGNFGGFDPTSSSFGGLGGFNSFGSSFDSPFDNSFGSNFGMFSNFNPFGMFTNRNRFNSSIKETPAHVKQRYKNPRLSNKCRELSEQIEKELNLEPQSIEKVMIRESGCNPQARNGTSGATGLIQFTKSTARRYGTTTAALYNMTAEEQMPYVRRYMIQAKKDAGYGPNDHLSAGEVYGLVFMPGLIKYGGGYKSGTSNYSQNRALDVNDNGIINKFDLDNVMKSIHIRA